MDIGRRLAVSVSLSVAVKALNAPSHQKLILVLFPALQAWLEDGRARKSVTQPVSFVCSDFDNQLLTKPEHPAF